MFGRAPKALPFRVLALWLGGEWSGGAVKKWSDRGQIPDDGARAIADVFGCSLDWLDARDGQGPDLSRKSRLWAHNGLKKGPRMTQGEPDLLGEGVTKGNHGVGGTPKSSGRAGEGRKRLGEQQMHESARLVRDAMGQVVDKHEVAGLDLRKVLMRMAAGLDALGHTEAALEIYRLVFELGALDVKGGTPPNPAA